MILYMRDIAVKEFCNSGPNFAMKYIIEEVTKRKEFCASLLF